MRAAFLCGVALVAALSARAGLRVYERARRELELELAASKREAERSNQRADGTDGTDAGFDAAR